MKAIEALEQLEKKIDTQVYLSQQGVSQALQTGFHPLLGQLDIQQRRDLQIRMEGYMEAMGWIKKNMAEIAEKIRMIDDEKKKEEFMAGLDDWLQNNILNKHNGKTDDDDPGQDSH